MPHVENSAGAPLDHAVIDRYVSAEMARQRIPGVALGIFREGTAVLAKGYGLSNVELGTPMTADSVLQSGSMGKSFVAVAIMMLVEEGKLHLDDSLVDYLPAGGENWRPIKIGNLLSHTSGLSSYDTPELQHPGGLFDIRQDFSENELVERIASLPIDFPAGESWAYENTNFVLLGALIRVITGQSYGEFFHERIFKPLGMNSSRIISDIDIIPNRSAGYEMVGGILRNQTWVSPTFNSTADGAMYFTIRDLERWDRALYGESLVSQKSLQQMWTPYPVAGISAVEGYGLGWRIAFENGNRVIGHNGSWQGFATSFARYVDSGLTVVALTNLDSAHSSPEVIVSAVAGLIDPKLQPRPLHPIHDERAELSASAWEGFQALMRGSPTVGVMTAFSTNAIEDLRASLPDDWDECMPALLERVSDEEGLLSTYRIGRAGNARLLDVLSNKDSEVTAFSIKADPDNR